MTFQGTSVLVATDLSPRCDRAVDRAARLAAEWNTRLKVVHVVADAPKGKVSATLTEDAVRASLPDPDINADILLPTGSPPSVIAKTAEEQGSGIIVTGVARFNDLRDYVLGTAVDYIIRHASVPVLVVKQRPHDAYRTLVVATDLSDASRVALLKAAALFPEAQLLLVHAAQVPFGTWIDTDEARVELQSDAKHKFAAFLDHPSVPQDVRDRVQLRISFGEVPTVLDEVLTETGADLLVIGATGTSALTQATLGSTASVLLTAIAQDTLVVRG